MANIALDNSLGGFIGSCWCQFGDRMLPHEDEEDDCCETIFLESCESTPESTDAPIAVCTSASDCTDEASFCNGESCASCDATADCSSAGFSTDVKNDCIS